MKEQNLGRVLTIKLTITDPQAAAWIWESGGKYPNPIHGVQVTGIADGDMFDEVRKLEEQLEQELVES